MASEINSTEARASAFQTRLPLPNCGALIKCEDTKSTSIVPSAIVNSSNSVVVSGCNNNNNNNNGSANNNNSNSPKMGSRRIFTPQFKLQVLESYRSDSDCKGNQRATARKYNIHRRQIQKWLQCESNLRSSVANINQNSVKHQFHNISHQHQHQQQQQSHSQLHSSAPRLSLPPIAAPSASRSGANNGYSHHHQHHQHALHNHHQHHPQVPSLDAATRQTLTLNSLNVPSMPARVAASSSAAATSAQRVLATNLAAAVAVAIASSTSPNSSSTTAVSPLRPTAIGGTAGGGSSSSMLHSHHHHHHQQHQHQHHHHPYPLSPYARSPVAAPVPVSVPMLPHHIAASHHHQQHYPYHNLSPHTHSHAQLPLSHQPSAFLPTACLPVNVLSAAVAAATSPPANATNTETIEDNDNNNCTTDANANVKAKLCEAIAQDTRTTNTNANATETKSMIALPQTMVTTTTTATKAATFLGTSARSSYIHEPEYECGVYRGAERMRDANCKNVFYQYDEHDALNISMTSPMDLSLGSRRKRPECCKTSTEVPKSTTRLDKLDVDDNTECHSQETDVGNSHRNDNGTNTQIVDLTFRKRKVVAACSTSTNDTEQPQKLAKRLEESSTEVDEKVTQPDADEDNEEDDDVEIEVEVDVDAKHLSSKPVKLFKPYLLDDDTDCNSTLKNNSNGSPKRLVMNEQREPIIWSNHPAFSSYDGSCASSLHSPTADKHTFPNGGSPYFLARKASSPQSVLSATSALSLSPTSFPLRCPKGSPVSGYESSSSTCSSEREDSFSRSYSLDFQMHTVCENKIMSTQPIHIREWFDQETTNADTNTPPLARASIALYA